MSNPSADNEFANDNPGGESGSSADSPTAVFTRLADVPLDAVDKLIETTQAVYDDLNRVMGHPYWGHLVFHQGAALRAMHEARDSLLGLRAEATGARNTELGVTVTTAVVDGERYYAHTSADKTSLVDQVLRTPGPRARHLYVWDRPYVDEDGPAPAVQIRVVVDTDAEVGALNYTEEIEDGELASWQPQNPEPVAEAPRLRFDAGSALQFPRDAVLPFRELRAALDEFVRSGQQPEAVTWQVARWGDF
ncbi:hypothetical protein GCM10027174_32010 [Salinifilum aidingensis]